MEVAKLRKKNLKAPILNYLLRMQQATMLDCKVLRLCIMLSAGCHWPSALLPSTNFSWQESEHMMIFTVFAQRYATYC